MAVAPTSQSYKWNFFCTLPPMAFGGWVAYAVYPAPGVLLAPWGWPVVALVSGLGTACAFFPERVRNIADRYMRAGDTSAQTAQNLRDGRGEAETNRAQDHATSTTHRSRVTVVIQNQQEFLTSLNELKDSLAPYLIEGSITASDNASIQEYATFQQERARATTDAINAYLQNNSELPALIIQLNQGIIGLTNLTHPLLNQLETAVSDRQQLIARINETATRNANFEGSALALVVRVSSGQPLAATDQEEIARLLTQAIELARAIIELHQFATGGTS